MIRRVMTLAIVLGGGLALGGCALLEGDKPSVERQASTCDSSYDRCVAGSNDWYQRNDRSRASTIDVYEQMLYGCRTRRDWCKEGIKTENSAEERTVKRSQREDKVPEPIEHFPHSSRPMSGSTVN